MLIRKVIMCLLMAACAVGAQAQVSVTTPMYVNGAGGNDANNGSTPALAKATIANAITSLSGQDGILIAAGTYNESALAIAGIVLQGGWNAAFDTYNPATNVTTIDAGGAALLGVSGAATTVQGLTLQNSSDTILAGALSGSLTLDTCTITGSLGQYSIIEMQAGGEQLTATNCTFDSNGNGSEDTLIRVDTGSGDFATFTNCTFSNNNLDRRLVFSDDGGDVTFTDCTFVNNVTDNDDLIRVRRQTGTVLIDGCTFTNNVGNLVALDDSYLMTGSLIIEDSVIENNTFTKIILVDADIGKGDINSSSTVILRNNVFDTNSVSNSQSDRALQGGIIRIVNNTFYGNSGSGLLSLTNQNNTPPASPIDAVAQNNIFSSNTLTNGAFAAFTADGVWSDVSYNIFHNTDPGTTDGSTAVALDGAGTGNHNFSADPLFENAAGSDFHIGGAPISPAVNAGTDTSGFGVSTDYDGDARPNGPAYDIGADESSLVPVELSDFTME